MSMCGGGRRRRSRGFVGNVENLVRAGRIYAADRLAWFAPALYTAPLVITEQCPGPACIDRYGRVYFNPHCIEKIHTLCGGESEKAVACIAYLWYHEICHWLREHFERAQEMAQGTVVQPYLWNIACDCEINDEVPEGLILPHFQGQIEPCLPATFGLEVGQIAECYYRQLQDNQKQSQGDRTEVEGRGDETDVQGVQTEDGDNQNKGVWASSAPLTSWDEGSGVHGQPGAWEVSAESEEVPRLTDFERAVLREEVARRILETAKERGNVPAGWMRWAREVCKPRVNWREKLKRVLRGAITQGFGQRLDYSFRRPNRRWEVYRPFVFPTLQGERRFRVACVVDTSGSMSEKDLSQAMAEVRGVLEQMRLPVVVIPCDAVPYEAVEVLTRSNWIESLKKLAGCGNGYGSGA